jgi:hypothetical protein
MSEELTLVGTNGNLKKFLPSIMKCRDFSAGEDAVKSSNNSRKYLPMLPGQAKDPVYGPGDYLVYKEYAEVFPGVSRTEESYNGVAFRKKPIIETPDDKYTDDFTLGGQSITEFAKELFDEVLESYRPGILVDIPATDIELNQETGFIPRGSVEDKDRPFATLYTAENILDWDEQRVDGVLKTVFIKLHEVERRINPDDEFDYQMIDRVRILNIDEEGFYQHRIYERQDTESTFFTEASQNPDNIFAGSYLLVATIYPKMQGNKMTEIPFFPLSPRGHEWELDYPPLNDLSNIAMSWYRNSASYENGLLLAGSPTLCLAGLDQEMLTDGNVKVGAGSVLLFDPEGSSWGYAQIGAEGLSEISKAMETKKQEMAVIGARILAGDQNGVEAAETAMIHRAGEHSVIMNIGSSLSGVLTEVLRLIIKWDTGNNPVSEDALFVLNIDFDFSKLSAQDLTALVAAMMSGSISPETFYYNLERGEMYGPASTFELEQERLVESKPSEEAPITNRGDNADNN